MEADEIQKNSQHLNQIFGDSNWRSEIPQCLPIQQLCASVLAAYKRRDARACSEAYAEDAVLLVHGSPPIRGRSEIAAAFQAGMDAGAYGGKLLGAGGGGFILFFAKPDLHENIKNKPF